VELRITRGFGAERLSADRTDPVPESLTVLRALESEHRVDTRFGGGFVQAIDGVSGGGPTGSKDWFYFVNGIEAEEGAADFELFPGDVVTWDFRYWKAAMRVPAIVGAYPEPFDGGREGRRLPTRVECEDDGSEACAEVRRRLEELGIPVTVAALGNAGSEDLLRVVVGAYPRVREGLALQTLESGPEESGVFARFTDEGTRLELLDEEGRAVRDAPPGSGLVAATRFSDQGVLWIVTGLDDAGVEAAARALDEETLRDAFAVAVTPTGPESLPVASE